MTNNKSIFRLTKAELSQMARIGQECVQWAQMVQSKMKTAKVLQQAANRMLGDAAKKRCEIVAKTVEFHTHWDGVYRTLGHPLSQTLGQSVTAPSELSFGAFLVRSA